MSPEQIYHDGRLDDRLLADYRASRKAYLEGDILRADQIYASNRRMHSIDLFYEVCLPEHVVLVHPLGTVLGRATYGDFFVAYNSCSVGALFDGAAPILGEGVCLCPGSRVLGNAVIGDNVFITANTVVDGRVIPSNSIVVGADVITSTKSVKARFFPDFL